jgi:hypothetical protein
MTPTLANLNPLNVNKSKSDVLTWEIHKIMVGLFGKPVSGISIDIT